MVKVKNIKVTNIPFKQNNDNFKKCINYIKSIVSELELENCMPNIDKQKISFELLDTNVDFANTIRRFIMDEIPVISMNVDDEKIVTDDRYILTDNLKKNIEMLRISQEIPIDAICSLTIENKTDEIIPIYSKDIVIVNKSKKLNTSDYLCNTIQIDRLRSGCTLNIPNITIVSGLGKHDSGKFLLISNIGYEILDVEPKNQTKFKTEGNSSLTSDPSHFRLEITNHRNIDITKIMPICCSIILNRITIIKQHIIEIDKDDKYITEYINIEKKGDITIIHLIGEYWTLSNLISRYCFLSCNDIQFVSPGIIHPATETSIVKIRHPNAIKVVLDSLSKIIDDVTVVHDAFSTKK